MKAVTSYLRLLARCAWVQILSWTGALRWAEQNLRERGAIVALTLHRVLDDVSLRSTNSLPGIIIRERTFAELVRYICERHEPVSLAEATPGSASQAIRIVTTFDDGWRDNYTTALPIVQAWRLPITIFVCPALVEQQEPFWPERAVALLRTTEPDAAADKFLRVIDEVKKCTAEEKRAFLESLGGSSADRTFPAASSSADRTHLWSEIIEMGRAEVCF